MKHLLKITPVASRYQRPWFYQLMLNKHFIVSIISRND